MFIYPGKKEMCIEEYSFSQCTLEQVSSFTKLINNTQYQSQPAFTCSKLTIETLEQGEKCVQS